MAKVLVVDDSPVDRRLAGSCLERRQAVTGGHTPTDLAPVFAANGREALDVIAREAPDLVVTDLLMPEMDGLELVREVRRRHPLLPVILVTAHGSEEVALEALRQGAASYVPKRNLTQDLLETVETVLALAA